MLKKVKIIDIIITALVLILFAVSAIYLLTALKEMHGNIFVHFGSNWQFDSHGPISQGKFGLWVGLGLLAFLELCSLFAYITPNSKKLTEKNNKALQSAFILLLSIHKIAIGIFVSFWNFSIGAQNPMMKGPFMMAVGLLGVAWVTFIGVTFGLLKANKSEKETKEREDES